MAKKLIVEIVGDSRSYERALGRSAKATKSFQAGITGMTGSVVKGLAVFTGVTVGARALASGLTGSVKASTDFQASLQKMIGLSGVAGSAIAGLRQDVLRLAPTVGKSPQELAEALFFITSSGIKAADALEVLKASAQASAAGLGETQVVADAVTSALNAYGQANISAEQATDVLVGTVREGKGEATEFAGVIGNVAAIAGELGVSFDQVGASLAAMTRLGTDAHTASIQLQQVFSALLSTSPKVNKAFSSVGLSLDDIRTQIAQPGGFLPALQRIKTAFKGNTVALRAAFPEIRAFRGVIALVGKQAAPVAGIFDRLAKSTGSLKTAFGAITQTQAQQFAKLNASIEVFRITLGSALAPAILDIIKPLNQWLSVSKNQEKVQRDIRETVKTVVGGMRDLVDVLKPLFETTQDVVGALGGFKNTLKLIVPLLVVSKFVNYGAAIAGVGTAAGTSTGQVRACVALLRLGAIGLITLGVEVVLHREEIDKKVSGFLEKHGLGFFAGNKKVTLPFDVKVENIEKFRQLRDNLAKIKGDNDLIVKGYDAIIDKLESIIALQNLNAAKRIVEPGEGRLGGHVTRPRRQPTTTTDPDVPNAAALAAEEKKKEAARKKAAAARKKAAEKAKQDAIDAAEALKKRNENIRAAAKRAQFQAIGLTGEGLKPTPGAGALRKVAGNLLDQIKGTPLDTTKTRTQLKTIVKFLTTHFKTAGRDVRDAILQMLNDIKGALESGDKTVSGPLTKTAGLNTRKLAEGLGLSPEQARELRQRASKFNTAGQRLVGNRSTGGAVRTQPVAVESHVTINLDGHKIANVVTRSQQKDRRRNPRQKRGQHRS